MTWFGGPGYLAALAVLADAALLLDQWLLRTGRTEVTTHHRHVAHRKLRALAEARIGGAAVSTSSETPHPAPVDSPNLRTGAGLNSGAPTVGLASTGTPRAVADGGHPGSRVMGDTLTAPCSVSEPHPAAQTVTADSRPSDGLGLQQPAIVGTPDSAVAGPQPHPRDEVVADAVRPRLAASATQLPNLVQVVDHLEFPLDAGAVAQTAPARTAAA